MMKRLLPLVFIACVFSGCGTFISSITDVNWTERETSNTFTDPMDVQPAWEAMRLRVPLLAPSSPNAKLASESKQSTKVPAIAPLGVSLGNGLLLDGHGYLFLDVLTLLHVDMNAPFRLTCVMSDYLSSKSVLQNRDGRWSLASSVIGKGEVIPSDTGLVMKTSDGGERFKLEREGTDLRYVTTNILDRSFELHVKGDTITAKETGILGHSVDMRVGGGVLRFNTDNNASLPAYTIQKRGDVYFIERRQNGSTASYKLYFTGRKIFLVQAGQVYQSVEVGDASIKVNGKEVVTYVKD